MTNTQRECFWSSGYIYGETYDSECEHVPEITDVLKSFNYTDNFVRFTTEAHVVYLLLQLYESRDAADTLDHDQLLSELSAAVVSQLWSLPSAHSVAELLDGKADDSYITDKWCGCGTGCAHNVSV